MSVHAWNSTRFKRLTRPLSNKQLAKIMDYEQACGGNPKPKHLYAFALMLRMGIENPDLPTRDGENSSSSSGYVSDGSSSVGDDSVGFGDMTEAEDTAVSSPDSVSPNNGLPTNTSPSNDKVLRPVRLTNQRQRPYRCPRRGDLGCKKMFSTPKRASLHARTHEFPCRYPGCDNLYSDHIHRRHHERTQHERPKAQTNASKIIHRCKLCRRTKPMRKRAE